MFDGGSIAGIYIEYMDVYDGTTGVPDVWWFRQRIYGTEDSVQEYAPYGRFFENDWTAWYNRWFEYNFSNGIVVDVWFGAIGSQGCQQSTLVLAH